MTVFLYDALFKSEHNNSAPSDKKGPGAGVSRG
jgi:hypothetical protein